MMNALHPGPVGRYRHGVYIFNDGAGRGGRLLLPRGDQGVLPAGLSWVRGGRHDRGVRLVAAHPRHRHGGGAGDDRLDPCGGRLCARRALPHAARPPAPPPASGQRQPRGHALLPAAHDDARLRRHAAQHPRGDGGRALLRAGGAGRRGEHLRGGRRARPLASGFRTSPRAPRSPSPSRKRGSPIPAPLFTARFRASWNRSAASSPC